MRTVWFTANENVWTVREDAVHGCEYDEGLRIFLFRVLTRVLIVLSIVDFTKYYPLNKSFGHR